jgi:hypothetical protein
VYYASDAVRNKKGDVHLVALATGPGVRDLSWPVAKPYQPAAPEVGRRVVGSTGAVWIDGDGDGKRTSALEYARRLLREAGEDWRKLVQALGGYDEAVAAQGAGLLQARGVRVQDVEVREAARLAGAQVERGFQAYAEAWRESQLARGNAR